MEAVHCITIPNKVAKNLKLNRVGVGVGSGDKYFSHVLSCLGTRTRMHPRGFLP